MYCILDLETTGLKDPIKICQIGILKVLDDEGVEELSLLCNPEKEIEDGAENLHHLREKVKDAPVFNEIKEQVENFLEGAEFIVGHNIIEYDEPILRECGLVLNAPLKDTLKMAKRDIKGQNRYSLDALCKNLGLSTEDEKHDALEDCKQTKLLYDYIQDNKRENLKLLEELRDDERANPYLFRLSKKLTCELLSCFTLLQDKDISLMKDIEIKKALKNKFEEFYSLSLERQRELLRESLEDREEKEKEDDKKEKPEPEPAPSLD